MVWFSDLWWEFVCKLYVLLGHPEWLESHHERRGMRKALGGRWGHWEIDLHSKVMGRFKIWLPSGCEHYPPPVGANSTEPLEVEEWT